MKKVSAWKIVAIVWFSMLALDYYWIRNIILDMEYGPMEISHEKEHE